MGGGPSSYPGVACPKEGPEPQVDTVRGPGPHHTLAWRVSSQNFQISLSLLYEDRNSFCHRILVK